MRTLFVHPPPIVEDWLAQRHALGQDLYDEVWEGEYRVAPAPSTRHVRIHAGLLRILGPLADRAGLWAGVGGNIGTPLDYRVPDLVFVREWVDRVWIPTAAIVVEVVSPDDESRAKLPFFFRAGAEEVLIVDPQARTVEWLRRGGDTFEPADGSVLLGITSTELAALIDWPG